MINMIESGHLPVRRDWRIVLRRRSGQRRTCNQNYPYGFNIISQATFAFQFPNVMRGKLRRCVEAMNSRLGTILFPVGFVGVLNAELLRIGDGLEELLLLLGGHVVFVQ